MVILTKLFLQCNYYTYDNHCFELISMTWFLYSCMSVMYAKTDDIHAVHITGNWMIVNMFPINVFTVYHSTVVTLCFRIYNVYALLHGIGMNQSDGKLLVYNGTSLFWTSLHGLPKVHAMFWDVLKYRSILISGVWNRWNGFTAYRRVLKDS